MIKLRTVYKKKIISIVNDPSIILLKLLTIFAKYLGDEFYVKSFFKLKMKKKLSIKKPLTFNEKLQWLKLYYKNPELTKMVDKYEAKKYVGQLIGDEYTIPTLGVWNNFDEIDFELLPNQFVLKTTHDQGGVVICKDKNKFDFKFARKKIIKHSKRNLYYLTREWPYKNVKPRIIAEKYMIDGRSGELKDYKFFCFNGVPKLLFVASDRQNKSEKVKFDYFDMNFKQLNITQAYKRSEKPIERPQGFEEMIELAKVLSKDLPHVRVDFYEINRKIYFGELTFFHHGGVVPFYPEAWDYEIGNYLKLPNKY